MIKNVSSFHDLAWAALQRRREQLPHALLLTGQGGIGKAALATAFAESLLCESPRSDSGLACGACPACHWFEQGNHPDFRFLQPEALSAEAVAVAEDGKKKASQQITIEQVRGLDEFLNVGTHRAGLRVILVNPAEAMNRNTANALLKSLEEPPPSTLFLLVSSEPLRLLPTIRSRCQQVVVPTPDTFRSLALLRENGIDEAEKWLALAGGSPLLARQLAGRDQGGWLEHLLESLAKGPRLDVVATAGQLDKLIRDAKGQLHLAQMVDIVAKWMVDLNLANNALPVRYFLDRQGTIGKLAAMIPPVRGLHAYRALLGQRRESEHPLNAKLFLERIFLDYRALFADSKT